MAEDIPNNPPPLHENDEHNSDNDELNQDIEAQHETINHAAPLNPSRLFRSALTVIVGFALTKLVSFGQVFIIADRFGAGADYDTFGAANDVPDQLVKFLAGGALTVAFIPIFSGLLNRNNIDGAWKLASQVFNTLLVVVFSLSVLSAIAAPWIIEYILAPGFSDWQVEQASILLRILLISTMIFTLSSSIGGMLVGHNHFLLPIVLAPIFQDIGLLLGIVVFTEWWGIYGLAWGTVFGAMLHFAVQIPGLFMYKARWSFSLGWNDPKLREVVRLMLPRMIASAIFTANFAAMTNIASRFGDGGISSFEFGKRIMDIPEALIGTALGIVVFPTLAALTELGKFEDRFKVFSEALRFVFVTTIPAGAGMLLIGHPAVDILFTDSYESALVYASVQVFAFAMILQAVHEIIARAFYAQKDTITPLIASAAGMVGNFAILIIAYTVYRQVDFIPHSSPLGVGIPALGYLTAFVVELGLLTIILRKRWESLDDKRVLDVIKRTIAATIFMAIPVLIVDTALSQVIFTDGGRIAGIIRSGMGGLLGVVFFGLGAYLFNIQEVKRFPGIIRRQLSNQLQEDATASA